MNSRQIDEKRNGSLPGIFALSTLVIVLGIIFFVQRHHTVVYYVEENAARDLYQGQPRSYIKLGQGHYKVVKVTEINSRLAEGSAVVEQCLPTANIQIFVSNLPETFLNEGYLFSVGGS